MDYTNETILNLLLSIGLHEHKRVRLGITTDPHIVALSNKISEVEAALFLEEHNAVPDPSELWCPRCTTPFEQDAIFCTECGLNIVEYYATHVTCGFCHQYINKTDRFCGICGTLQEGDR